MTTTISILNGNQLPSAFITIEALARVHEIVRQSDKEVGWMGQMVQEVDDKGMISLTLFNPYVPRQEVSGATTDIDADDIAKYALSVDNPDLIKWWGHSHVNMGVSPSGTDITTFNELVENDPDNPFVMTIHNKSHVTHCNIYLGKGLYINDADLHIDWDDEEMVESVAKELKDNVRDKVYVTPKFNQANGNYSGKSPSKRKSKRSGSGSNRKQLSHTTQQQRNVASNTVGFGYS